MRPTFMLAVLAGTIGFALPARADVTAADAAALAASFIPYFGRAAVDQGIVTVEPHGQDYAVSFDLDRAMANFSLPGFSFDIGRWTFLTHPLAGGRWQVTSDALPSATLTLPTPLGPQSYTYTFDGYTFTGVYDPSLASFLTSTSSLAKLAMTSHAATGDADVQMSGVKFSSSATPADDGTVAEKLDESIGSLDEALHVRFPTSPPSAAPVAVGVHIGSTTFDASVDAARAKELIDLWRFFVSHPGSGDLVSAQNDLKGLLAAALPLWSGLDLRGSGNDISVTTPRGVGTLKRLEEHVAGSGISADASLDLGVDFEGLTLPAGMLPAEFQPLVPTSLALAVRLDDVDLDTPARALIKALDLKQSPPVSKLGGLAILGGIVSRGAHVSFDGGELKTSSLDVLIDGDLSLTAKPTGEITLQARGLSDTIAALAQSSARNPLLREAQIFLTAARRIARVGADDQAVWLIDYDASGGLKVNGREVWAPDQ